jgi:F0F1-type ATP synthase assembly protein I
MSQNNQLPEPTKKDRPASNLALYSVGAEVGCSTLVIILLGLFIGIGLDRLLDTKPVFTILLTLGSAPLSLFITYHLAMRAVKSVTPQESAGTQPKPVKEEEKRE